MIGMHRSYRWVVFTGLLIGSGVLTGCQHRLYKKRDYYRQQADTAVNCIVQEKSIDPRWALPQLDVYMDPRSRYFDGYHPDHAPMPTDDPYAHQYMHSVYGMKGWKHWHDDGDRPELENPDWYDELGGYVELNENGDVKLTLDSALKLAYVHSPGYQGQLETLYLSALDVTAERFRLDTQFFGGFDSVVTHTGKLRSAAGERTTVSVGRGASATGLNSGISGSGGSNLFQWNRKFATAGTMVVGFANSFVWQLAGPDTNQANSIINFNLVQPLLRQAGRDVALEQLTIVERAMLSNLRAFQRYRQGFYTQVAIGQSGVTGAQRRGGFFGGTGLTGFTGQGSGGLGGVGEATGFGRAGFGGTGGGGGGGTTGFAGGGAGTVGGFIGLLQQLQQIRNTQDSLTRQMRTVSLLEAHLEAGVIDLTQVDQFRQNIETEKANLLQAQNDLQTSIESYLIGTLGLPPHLPVDLDDSLIEQFQFVDPRMTQLQDQVGDLQEELGVLPDPASLDQVRKVLADIDPVRDGIQEHFDTVHRDLELLADRSPQRERGMTPEEHSLFNAERKRLQTVFDDLRTRFTAASERLDKMPETLTEETKAAVTREMVIWLTDLLKLTQELTLVQARARLESIVIDPVELTSDEAFLIAQSNRLDYMNNRAALVDTWRLIAFNADALQSNFNVVFSGDVRTHHDNPFDFRSQTGALQAGIQFDAPYTRLLERNNYRSALISYQQDRRQLIQFRDSMHQTLRQAMRRLKQLQTNLEIQRRAMAISIRRVDLTQEDLNKPSPPPAPGESATQFGPTAVLSLLTALSDLRSTQNNFMSVWLNYEATRMALLRELGIMVLDEDGKWVDLPIAEIERNLGEELPLPPSVPYEWLQDSLPIPRTNDAAPLPTPAGPQPPRNSRNSGPPAVVISYE